MHDHGIIYAAQTQVVNVNLKLRLHNHAGIEFLHLKCGKILRSRNLQLRTTLHYLCGVLVRTTSNKTVLHETLKSRHLKLGLFCIYNTGQTKICSLHTYNLYHVLVSQCQCTVRFTTLWWSLVHARRLKVHSCKQTGLLLIPNSITNIVTI